jgi:hypothetical protein
VRQFWLRFKSLSETPQECLTAKVFLQALQFPAFPAISAFTS